MKHPISSITCLSPAFRAVAVIALVSILNCSCSDDKPASSKRPLLTDKTWTVVRYEMDGEDETDGREECETDNTTTFFADGTFIDAIGDMPCEELEKNTEGTWEFKANETIISIRPAGETASDWTILELTETTLRMSQYAKIIDAEIVVVMAPL